MHKLKPEFTLNHHVMPLLCFHVVNSTTLQIRGHYFGRLFSLIQKVHSNLSLQLHKYSSICKKKIIQQVWNTPQNGFEVSFIKCFLFPYKPLKFITSNIIFVATLPVEAVTRTDGWSRFLPGYFSILLKCWVMTLTTKLFPINATPPKNM